MIPLVKASVAMAWSSTSAGSGALCFLRAAMGST